MDFHITKHICYKFLRRKSKYFHNKCRCEKYIKTWTNFRRLNVFHLLNWFYRLNFFHKVSAFIGWISVMRWKYFICWMLFVGWMYFMCRMLFVGCTFLINWTFFKGKCLWEVDSFFWKESSFFENFNFFSFICGCIRIFIEYIFKLNWFLGAGVCNIFTISIKDKAAFMCKFMKDSFWKVIRARLGKQQLINICIKINPKLFRWIIIKRTR